MLGIVMDEENKEGAETRLLKNVCVDLVSPNRSIQDFFKPADKNPVATKSKNLLDFFGKSSKGSSEVGSKTLPDVHNQENCAVQGNSQISTDILDSIPCQNKKSSKRRKKSGDKHMYTSVNDFEPNGKTDKHKKKKKHSKLIWEGKLSDKRDASSTTAAADVDASVTEISREKGEREVASQSSATPQGKSKKKKKKKHKHKLESSDLSLNRSIGLLGIDGEHETSVTNTLNTLNSCVIPPGESEKQSDHKRRSHDSIETEEQNSSETKCMKSVSVQSSEGISIVPGVNAQDSNILKDKKEKKRKHKKDKRRSEEKSLNTNVLEVSLNSSVDTGLAASTGSMSSQKQDVTCEMPVINKVCEGKDGVDKRVDRENVKSTKHKHKKHKKCKADRLDGKSSVLDDSKTEEMSYSDFISSFYTTENEDESTDKNNVSEVSYDEFISSLYTTDYETDCTKTESNVDPSPQQKDSGEKDVETDSKYPAITKFFTKQDNKVKCADKENFESVTVKADIHPEPSPPLKAKSETKVFEVFKSKNKDKKCSNSNCKLSYEDDIEVLGTEIIKLDNQKGGQKKNKCENEKETITVDISDEDSACSGSSKQEHLETVNSNSVVQKNVNSVSVADEECHIIETTEEDKKKTAFLKSSAQALPARTMQATLSFTKSGLQMNKTQHNTRVRKPEVESNTENTVLAETESKTKGCKKSKHRRKAEKDKECLLSNPMSESTPIKTTKHRKKRKSSEKTETEGDQVGEHDGIGVVELLSPVGTENTSMSQLDKSGVSERRQSLRKKYRVSFLMIDENSKTPLKMKIKRCNKSISSTSGEDSFTPRSARHSEKAKAGIKHTKHSKAKELLVKAKKVKKKKRASKDRDEPPAVRSKDRDESPAVRRSDRQKRKSLEMEDVVIVEDEPCSEQTSKKRKSSETGKGSKNKNKETPRKDAKPKTGPKKDGKSTPKKAPTTGTPKKSGNLKMAPIFMKNKKPDDVEEVAPPPLDPEKERLRREFLMSGVPQALRRQAEAASVVLVTDYPPIPTVSHVQQQTSELSRKDTLDVWKLSEITLPMREVTVTPCLKNTPLWRPLLISKEETDRGLEHIKSFQSHKDIADSCLTQLLGEIGRCCPAYPVKNMYKSLLNRKQESEKLAVDLVAASTTATEPEKSTQKRRQSSGECVIILDEDSENKDTSHEKRRSLRRKKTNEKDKQEKTPNEVGMNTDQKSVDQQAVPQEAPALTWTEKYQPSRSSEIIGNSGSIKRLKAWLSEWKQWLDREARKAKKLLRKQSKNKKSSALDNEAEWWTDDGSDFDMDSSDSDDEDDLLCNTALITGPHGVGKTATVYALAQELGFKVFEVNASSSRNGKKILSQLQEATQSHRVSHSTGPGEPEPAVVAKPTADKKLPSAFANLFKKAAPSAASSAPPAGKAKSGSKHQDGAGRKRKRDMAECDEETPKKSKKAKKSNFTPAKSVQKGPLSLFGKTDTPSTPSKGLNLTSTSLILFDEVDVIFEDDKGFLAAVQNFMSTTKIPIMLTTTDPNFSAGFEGRYEQHSLKMPPTATLTAHLQLVCLVENVRTDFQEMASLAVLLGGDVRHSLLTLQYWIDSGGGCLMEKRPVGKLEPKALPFLLDDNTCSQDGTVTVGCETSTVVPPTSQEDDDDDFVTLKPTRPRVRRVLVDEDSCSSVCPLSQSSSSSQKEVPSSGEEAGSDLPDVHLLPLDSVLGSSVPPCRPVHECLRQCVQALDDCEGVDRAVTVCASYSTVRCDIIYTSLLDMLPLKKSKVCSELVQKVPQQKQEKKRIRIKTDLYDSEASNDGISSQEESSVLECAVQEEPEKSELKEEKLLTLKSIQAFSQFYDSMSFLDTMAVSVSRKDLDSFQNGDSSPGSLSAGLSDHVTNYDTPDWWTHSHDLLLTPELEVRELRRLCRDLSDVQETVENLQQSCPSLKDKFSLPLSEQSSTLVRDPERLVIRKAHKNVMSSLPLSVHNWQAVGMDYLPTLRAISHAEQCRQVAKTKRRFYHYFDGIDLGLKETTLNVLCSSFQS